MGYTHDDNWVLLFFFLTFPLPDDDKHQIILWLIWVSCGLRRVRNLHVWGKPTTFRIPWIVLWNGRQPIKKWAESGRRKQVYTSTGFSVLYFILKTVPGPPSCPLLVCPLPCCVFSWLVVDMFRLLRFCLNHEWSCGNSRLKEEILDRWWDRMLMCAKYRSSAHSIVKTIQCLIYLHGDSENPYECAPLNWAKRNRCTCVWYIFFCGVHTLRQSRFCFPVLFAIELGGHRRLSRHHLYSDWSVGAIWPSCREVTLTCSSQTNYRSHQCTAGIFELLWGVQHSKGHLTASPLTLRCTISILPQNTTKGAVVFPVGSRERERGVMEAYTNNTLAAGNPYNIMLIICGRFERVTDGKRLLTSLLFILRTWSCRWTHAPAVF